MAIEAAGWKPPTFWRRIPTPFSIHATSWSGHHTRSSRYRFTYCLSIMMSRRRALAACSGKCCKLLPHVLADDGMGDYVRGYSKIWRAGRLPSVPALAGCAGCCKGLRGEAGRGGTNLRPRLWQRSRIGSSACSCFSLPTRVWAIEPRRAFAASVLRGARLFARAETYPKPLIADGVQTQDYHR